MANRDKTPYTLSFFVKVEQSPPPRWWHRLLRVSPRPVPVWVRRQATSEFTDEGEAKSFAKVLFRPEMMAGLLGATGTPALAQMEQLAPGEASIPTTSTVHAYPVG